MAESSSSCSVNPIKKDNQEVCGLCVLIFNKLQSGLQQNTTEVEFFFAFNLYLISCILILSIFI